MHREFDGQGGWPVETAGLGGISHGSILPSCMRDIFGCQKSSRIIGKRDHPVEGIDAFKVLDDALSCKSF